MRASLFESEARNSKLYPYVEKVLETMNGSGLRVGMISTFPATASYSK